MKNKLGYVALLFALAVVDVDVGLAQTMNDFNTCKSSTATPDQSIRACNVFIRTRRSVGGKAPLPSKALAAIYGIRALHYLRMGNKDQALDDMNHALATNSDDVTTKFTLHEQRAQLYFHRHNYRDAVRGWTDALEYAKTKPARANILMFRAQAYQLMGDDERARKDYEQAGTLVPSLREGADDLREHNARWIGYLKEIEKDNDFVNWSGPPWRQFQNAVAGPLPSVQPSASSDQKTSNPDACAAATVHWQSAESIGTLAAYQDHLARFPMCAFANLARARIAALIERE